MTCKTQLRGSEYPSVVHITTTHDILDLSPTSLHLNFNDTLGVLRRGGLAWQSLFWPQCRVGASVDVEEQSVYLR